MKYHTVNRGMYDVINTAYKVPGYLICCMEL